MTQASFQMPERVKFATLRDIRAAGERHIDSARHSTFDLTGLKDCNSAAVALLLAWYRYAHHKSCEVIFVGAPDSLQNLIEVTELDEILPMRK